MLVQSRLGEAILSNESSSADSFVHLNDQPVLLTFSLFMALLGTIGNTLVLILFWMDRRQISIGHYYIISMAVSDLLETMLGAPLTAFFRLYLTIDDPICPVVHGVKVAIFVCCLLSVVLTAIDRYWSIVHMVHYRNNSTHKFAIGLYFRIPIKKLEKKVCF